MRRADTVGVACPLVLSAVPMSRIKGEDVPGRTCGVLLLPVGDADGEDDEAEVVSEGMAVGDVPFWAGGDMIFQRDGRRWTGRQKSLWLHN